MRLTKLRVFSLVVAAMLSGLAVHILLNLRSVPLVVDKATTYITEPLRPDGSPDYVAALNQQSSRGVTPETNAVVLLLKATGPGEIRKECREKYFKLLGIAPLPEKGDYLVPSEQQPERHNHQNDSADPPKSGGVESAYKELESAVTRPWSKQEFPLWADWLAVNEKPLLLVVEATKRPRYYEPLVPDDAKNETLLDVPTPCTLRCRDFQRLLAARAMLRLHNHEIDAAWQDLLACHRLTRLVGQGPRVIDLLVAAQVECFACQGDWAVLRHAKLTAPQIARMRADLAGLPPMPTAANTVDNGERLILLDSVMSLRRQTTPSQNAPAAKLGLSASSRFDWNVILSLVNVWCDRAVAAMRKPTHAERQAALEATKRDLHEESEAMRGLGMAAQLIKSPREAVARTTGLIFCSLTLPATAAASTAADRRAMIFDLTDLAFALAAYRADCGSYPAKPSDLAPKYVKRVPKDIFNNDKDLHYTRQGDGYLLYSVGVNGKDDQGRSYDDRKNNEDWDDLTVRMSATSH